MIEVKNTHCIGDALRVEFDKSDKSVGLYFIPIYYNKINFSENNCQESQQNCNSQK